MSSTSDREVLPPSEFSGDEAREAASYWANRGVRPFYLQETHWAAHVAERVASFAPRSVLEFGCNAGRNLAAVRRRVSADVEIVGVDVNEAAIAEGSNAFADLDLDLEVGDERWLAGHADEMFDLVFTVSVLDHVPDPASILRELVRLAGRAVLLLEPNLGEEGRVVRDRDPRSGEIEEATPYSYSWDYQRLLRDVAPGLEVTSEPYPLDGTRWGVYYELFTAVKDPAAT